MRNLRQALPRSIVIKMAKIASVSTGAALLLAGMALAQTDPGVQSGNRGTGATIITSDPNGFLPFFTDGQGRFQEVENVSKSANVGLGPRFNSNQCSSCHAQPAIGGTGAAVNPQFAFAGSSVAPKDATPYFITANGPTREARFPFFFNANGTVNTSAPNGGVEDLFTVSGRSDAGSCSLPQPSFSAAGEANDIIFRIPTPVFGAGLIENLDDSTLLINQGKNNNNNLGISGTFNHNGNDGTISRFGWKAQNKSLEIFSGEAYNVEMGITNELFTNERASPDEEMHGGLPASCMLNPTPEDASNPAASPDSEVPSDVVMFAMFMRLLAPPTPSTMQPGGAQSIANGKLLFSAVGCALCHTPSMQTGQSGLTPGLNNATANLYSDLLVHDMGMNLADGVSQGTAAGNEFRTAPLWGLGQRVFFLHDGRSHDLLDAIRQHASQGSEANGVIGMFNHLNQSQMQDLLNFLRSL